MLSAGAQIATNVGIVQNNPEYPNKLDEGITITGIINFSSPVDGLDLIERIFSEHEYDLFSQVEKALFAPAEYESKENITIYEPITYFDQDDPPIFLCQGALDDQVPPVTFDQFVLKMRRDKDLRMFVPNGKHSPNQEEFDKAYAEIFKFLDGL